MQSNPPQNTAGLRNCCQSKRPLSTAIQNITQRRLITDTHSHTDRPGVVLPLSQVHAVTERVGQSLELRQALLLQASVASHLLQPRVGWSKPQVATNEPSGISFLLEKFNNSTYPKILIVHSHAVIKSRTFWSIIQHMATPRKYTTIQ